LTEIFEKLNIETKVLNDLGFKDVKDETERFSRDESFANASMSVFVIMAHGEEDSQIRTANGRLIKTEEIIDLFDDRKCPNLKGKPKWFIFQVKLMVSHYNLSH